MSDYRRGRFVTIDGPSAVGKTTATRHVADMMRARGCDVVATTTPSESDLGRLARASTFRLSGYALGCLVAADRYHHYATVVVPALDRGQLILCDRHTPSAYVLDTTDGVATTYVSNLYEALPAPDIAIILDGDSDLCAARAIRRASSYSRFHSTDQADHERERDKFHATFTTLRGRGYPVRRVEIGHDDETTVAARIVAALCAEWG